VIPAPAFAASELRPTPLGRLHPATRLGGAVLGMVTVFSLPAVLVPVAVLVPALFLVRTGLDLRRQLRSLAPWWPVALLVLAVHTLTTTSAAPLGRPSLAGLLAGLTALARVAGSAAWLGLLMRATNLDELVTAMRWWNTPLRRLGLRDENLPLVLVVALGTAPTVLGEARRIEAVLRLRRGACTGSPNRFGRARDRARVVVPLLEALVRRGEALALSLRRRRPVGLDTGGPAWSEGLLLLAWAAALAASFLVARGVTP
jgi:energy-coupling factor transporter transmembrane protein EcfT